MAKINTLKTIEVTRGNINACYDMTISDIDNIYNKNLGINKYGMIADAFVFGYAQGLKATKKSMGVK